jgi:hypothetical protein
LLANKKEEASTSNAAKKDSLNNHHHHHHHHQMKPYVISKNEFQLPTKPPVKVTIEPTCECPGSLAATPKLLSKDHPIGPIATPPLITCKYCSVGSAASAGLASPPSTNYLVHQRGSILYPDPIKTTLINSLLTG